MKKILIAIAMMACASPAMADEGLLTLLGLSGLEEVTAAESSEVKGRGFVLADGETSSSIARTNANDGTHNTASDQKLDLEGLNVLEGLLGANSTISFSFSQNDGTTSSQYQGEVTTGSTTVVAGAAK
jgi:hypothetical protein